MKLYTECSVHTCIIQACCTTEWPEKGFDDQVTAWPLPVTKHQNPASSQGCDEAVGSAVYQTPQPTTIPGHVTYQLLGLTAVSGVLQSGYCFLNCRG